MILRVVAALAAVVAYALPAVGASAAQRIAVAKVHSADTVGITVVGPGGGSPRPLTRHVGWQDDDPSWSPDGRRIAFSRTTDGYRSIRLYVMRSDGSHVRRLTRGRFDERPSWSPDGRWIAYQSAGGFIRLVRPDATGVRRVPGTRGAGWPAWSPDGDRIAFAQSGAVWTAKPDGTGRRRVVAGREPAWSPDGRQIAYTRPDGGIGRVDLDTGAVTDLGRGMQPAWSPGGARLAIARWPAGERFSVWTMDPAGGDRRLVLRGARSPAWRP